MSDPVVVQSNSASGGVLSISVTLDNPVAAGNSVVYVALGPGCSGTFSSIADNTSDAFPTPDIDYNPSGNNLVIIGHLSNITTGPTEFTLDINGTSGVDLDLVVYEVEGIVSSSPLDVAKTANISFGASPRTTTYTTTAGTDFAVAGWGNSSTGATAISGWTIDESYSNGIWGAAHLISPASGSNSFSMTVSGNTAAVVGIAAYKAAVAGIIEEDGECLLFVQAQ